MRRGTGRVAAIAVVAVVGAAWLTQKAGVSVPGLRG